MAAYSYATAFSPTLTLRRGSGSLLIPESDLTCEGLGPTVSLGTHLGEVVLLDLEITRVVERGSLEVSLWGSEDGQNWGCSPMVMFPKKYFCGTYELRWDSRSRPEVRYLRAQWQVQKVGGRGAKALFTATLGMRETSLCPVTL